MPFNPDDAKNIGDVPKNVVVIGVFSSAPLSLTNEQGVPLQLDSAGSLRSTVVSAVQVGAHANAWNAATVGVNEVSASVDCRYTPNVSAFGSVSAVATITMQYSQNNVNFYDGPAFTLSAAGDFRIDAIVGARYVRLRASASATITASICAKA